MTSFQGSPKSDKETVYFCTKRNGLQLGNVVYLSDQDSPCLRDEPGALEFEIPWGVWRGRAAILAVETDKGSLFAEGEQDGVVRRVRPVKPPSGYRGQIWIALTSTDGEWQASVAERFGLLD